MQRGDKLQGGIRLDALIAKTNMSEVWRGSSETGEPVVVKALRQDRAPDDVARERFLRETEILSRLTTERFCRLLGMGTSLDGIPFFVTEHLVGETLAARLKRESILAAPDARWVVSEMLLALSEAHLAGIVHRDVKPSNVFLPKAPERGVKLLDFGISSFEGAKTLTSQGAVLGSLGYMAPEQIGGESIDDPRLDLYAAGVTAYRCISGRLPFEGRDLASLVVLKRSYDPPTLEETTSLPWPEPFELFFARALARSAESRFSSASEMSSRWDLLPFERIPGIERDAGDVDLGDDTDAD